MIWRIIAVALVGTLGAAPPAEAGFWGDLRQSFGTAVDNAQRDGAEAIDAITGGGGDAAAGGTESAADRDTEESAGAPETAEAPVARPLDSSAEPVADGSKQLSKQPKK